MITNALSKYHLFISLTSLKYMPQFRWFSVRVDRLSRSLLCIFSSSHHRKMIGMRRGLWGKKVDVPRQNQTDSRDHHFVWRNSSQQSRDNLAAVVTSSTANLESMPAADETAVSPATKRSRFEADMPTNNVIDQTTAPVMPAKPKLRFTKLSGEAKAPTKGSDFAAGFDLYSAYEYIIPAGGKERVLTDIAIELPEDCYGRVAPRSGLAWNNHIDVGAGVIDRDYRGNVGVILFNLGQEDFKVNKHMRIAQLLCERICYPELEEVEKLEKTVRGSGGYGSTGTK